MQNNRPKFKVGDIVALNADSSRKGPVIGMLPSVQGQHRYRVFHSTNDIREYLEDQITSFQVSTDHITGDQGLRPEEFLARLNSLRLSYPQADSLYALHAARIQFISFQFKPLLRFFRADRPRLLIADEVGVGRKDVELIFSERHILDLQEILKTNMKE